MITKERIKNWKLHPSMRGQFSFELYKAMANDKNIILLVGDLGWGVFDNHRDDMPDQFCNCGAAEVAMMDMAVGLAMSGKIPVVYSITTFLLYRPFEVIRNYINKEKWPVKLAGSGRNKDYVHDGFSHDSSDAVKFFYPFTIFDNIKALWPETKEEIPNLMGEFLYNENPYFLSLRR